MKRKSEQEITCRGLLLFKRAGVCLLGLISLVALFYFSWIPSSEMAEIPWLPHGMGVWLDSPTWRDPRTALPCVLLGVGVGSVLPRLGPFARQWLLFGLYVLPLAAELGQIFISYRTCSLWDVLWGWVGLTFGLLFVPACRHLRRAKKLSCPRICANKCQ